MCHLVALVTPIPPGEELVLSAQRSLQCPAFLGKAPSCLGSVQRPGKVPDLAVTLLFDSDSLKSPLEQLTWARHQIYKENTDKLKSHGGKEQE